jgi:hypothetical protein
VLPILSKLGKRSRSGGGFNDDDEDVGLAGPEEEYFRTTLRFEEGQGLLSVPVFEQGNFIGGTTESHTRFFLTSHHFHPNHSTVG